MFYFLLRMRRTLAHDNCTLLVAQVSYPPQVMRGKMPRLRGQGNRMEIVCRTDALQLHVIPPIPDINCVSPTPLKGAL